MKSSFGNPFFNPRMWTTITVLVVLILTACAPAVPVPETGQQQGVEANPKSAKAAAKVPTSLSLLIGQEAGADTLQILLTDLQTGKPAEGIAPIDIGTEMNYAFSPDGEKLAVASKGAGCTQACLRVFQLDNLEAVSVIELPDMKFASDYVHQMTFDSQSARLAVAYGQERRNRFAVIDTTSNPPTVIQDIVLTVFPRLTAFSEDGKQIMLLGHNLPGVGTPADAMKPLLHALSFDAQTLQVKWQQALPEVKDGFFGSGNHEKPEENFYYSAGMAVDPSRQRIYIAHADEAKLTTIDFGTKAVTTSDIREKQSAVERILGAILSFGVQPVQAKAANSYFRQAILSSDGKTLYVVGEANNMVQKDENQWEMIYTPLGLEAWDIESGTRLLALETQASEIRQGPRGLLLLNGYDRDSHKYQPFTEIFDPAAGQIAAHLDETYAFLTLRLDGQPALVSVYSTDQDKTFLDVLNETSLQKELSWTQNAYFFWPELR